MEIGSFVNKIEGIAFDVKILAINAMVEALKTNAAGNALTVLAKELSNLSQETRDGATDSIEMLQSIMEGTEKQLEFSVNLDQSSVVVDEMIDRAKKFTGTILSSLQEVSLLGHKMDSSSRDLSSKITQLIPGIKFPQVLGDRIDRNWQTICRTIDQIEEAYPQFQERSSEVKQMVENLAQQYVMERERSIHAQVAGGEEQMLPIRASIDLFEDDGFELFDDNIPRRSPVGMHRKRISATMSSYFKINAPATVRQEKDNGSFTESRHNESRQRRSSVSSGESDPGGGPGNKKSAS